MMQESKHSMMCKQTEMNYDKVEIRLVAKPESGNGIVPISRRIWEVRSVSPGSPDSASLMLIVFFTVTAEL